MSALEKPHLFCIYSEDIRNEASGQSTIIGWFTNGAIQFPPIGILTLQRFGVQCILELPPALMLESLKCDILLGEQVLQSIVLPQEALQGFMADRDHQLARDPHLRGFMVNVTLQLMNFAVPRPGALQVRAIVNGDAVVSNSIQFVAADMH